MQAVMDRAVAHKVPQGAAPAPNFHHLSTEGAYADDDTYSHSCLSANLMAESKGLTHHAPKCFLATLHFAHLSCQSAPCTLTCGGVRLPIFGAYGLTAGQSEASVYELALNLRSYM